MYKYYTVISNKNNAVFNRNPKKTVSSTKEMCMSGIWKEIFVYSVDSKKKTWSSKFNKVMVHVKNAAVQDGGIGNQEIRHVEPVDIRIVITKDNDDLVNLFAINTELGHL